MRWSALILVLGFLFAPSSLSAQQVTFSESDAQNNLNAMAAGANGCWVYFRLGEYKFIITEAAQGGSMYEQAQNLLALKGIGVINWIDLESMLGWAHFKIELRPDVDQAEVMSLQINNMACLKVSTSPEVYKILKVENVKGGHTNWDGAVVYATVQTTPLRRFTINSLPPEISLAWHRERCVTCLSTIFSRKIGHFARLTWRPSTPPISIPSVSPCNCNKISL
jgi:hypothetical protein